MALDLTDADIYSALAGFCALFVPTGTEIRRGQQNRVPMPPSDFVQLTTIGAPRRIGTNSDSTEAVFDSSGTLTGFTATVTADFEYHVQADFVSSQAESWAMSAELLWLDGIAWDFMPQGIKPLYSEGRQQLPIIGGEDQWIQRWTMTLVLDYQPTFTQPTQAATVLDVVAVPVDVFAPPDYTADSQISTDSNRTM